MMNRTTNVVFSFSSTACIQNPYPFYDKLRAHAPIHRVKSIRYPGWYVTGYEEVKTILSNSNFQTRIPLPLASEKYKQLKCIQNDMMLFQNGMDHRRLRKVATKLFTPTQLAHYRLFILETVHKLLDRVEAQGEMEVVTDFAFPLASAVIAKIIGIPTEKLQSFRVWSAHLIHAIDLTRSRNTLKKGNETVYTLQSYFKKWLKETPACAENTLLHVLHEEDRLTENECLAMCILLVIAGHETTVNLISNGLWTLLNHPSQYERLKDHPAHIETAVEEFLRFESPTQMTARVAATDVEIGGRTIQQGEQLYLMLGAANRDPKQFQFPNRLDICRDPNPHLSFGYGSHFCLGAQLARMEAQIAIQTITMRFHHLQVVGPPQWRKLVGFRALEKLPLRLSTIK